MAPELLPVWEVPRDLLVWQPRLHRRVGPGQVAFSYGLVFPELAGLGTADGVRSVAERWGIEQLVGLARRRRNDLEIRGEPPLADIASALEEQARFPLFEEAALAEGRRVLADRPALDEATLAARFEDFARSDGIALVEWFGFRSIKGREPLAPSAVLAHGRLGAFYRHLQNAAGGQSRIEVREFVGLVGTLYDTLRVERAERPLLDQSGKERRAPSYRDLAERAALEVEHLVTFEPRVARCRLCGRVFVTSRPGTPEQHCRQNLWLGRPPYPMLERCMPTEGRERERIRKALDQRYRRALARHGGDRSHPEVKKRLADYNHWLRDNPSAPRGRRPEAQPTFVPNDKRGGGNG